MVHHVLAFDWDGTCVQHVGDVKFDDPESLRESCIRDREVQKRVLQLVQGGHAVHVVTARGRKVRDVTLQQVRDLHPEIQVHHQERFEGFVAMRNWKAAKLQEIAAEAYVGDHMVDEMAAGDAGVPYMHVDEYRSGGNLLALVGELPSPRQGQDAAVLQVVPRDRVARARRGPEEGRVPKKGAPRAARGQEAPGAVEGLVGKHVAVRKVVHAHESTRRRKAKQGKRGR